MNYERALVKIVPMEGKFGRYKVVRIEDNSTVIDGNGYGYKSRVNAVRAVNKNDYKIVYDPETKADCSEFYRERYNRNYIAYEKGWYDL